MYSHVQICRLNNTLFFISGNKIELVLILFTNDFFPSLTLSRHFGLFLINFNQWLSEVIEQSHFNALAVVDIIYIATFQSDLLKF